MSNGFSSKNAIICESFPQAVVVLGTGSIGSRHLRVLSEMKGVRPVAAPIRLTRRRFWRKQGVGIVLGIKDAFSRGIDRAIIATETGRHLSDSLGALNAGMHILVEKPLSTGAAPALKICREAKRRARMLFVAFPFRFSHSLAHVKRLLPKLGDIHSVQLECRSFLPDWRPNRSYKKSYSSRASEGGVLRDLIHEIDYAGWLFGWPQRLYARLLNFGRLKIDSEEVAHLTWRVEGGPLVSINLDYITWPPRRRMNVFGRRGSLRWDGISDTVELFLRGRPPVQSHFNVTRDQIIAAQDKAFLNAQSGKWDSRLVTGNEALQAMAICDTARESSKKGKILKVKQIPWMT